MKTMPLFNITYKSIMWSFYGHFGDILNLGGIRLLYLKNSIESQCLYVCLYVKYSTVLNVCLYAKYSTVLNVCMYVRLRLHTCSTVL